MESQKQKSHQSKDSQKEGQDSLYTIVHNLIPKNVITNKNKGKQWMYGYDEKYDIAEMNNKIKEIRLKIKSSSIEINGCRRNILRFNLYDYPLFTVLDQFEIYNGQTKAGKYYVETNNYMPLRGNGFYYYPTIKYCLEENIIEESDIKYCLLSSMVTPSNYYNDFIDYCVDMLLQRIFVFNEHLPGFRAFERTHNAKGF